MPTRPSTTSTPTRTTSRRPAARSFPSSSPTGPRSGSARTCTSTTCQSFGGSSPWPSAVSARSTRAARTTTSSCESTEQARRVHHLPIVGYHWRMGAGSAAANPDAKPYAFEAGQRAVQAHCERVGIDATVEMLPRTGLPPAPPAAAAPPVGERRHPDGGRRWPGLGCSTHLRRGGGAEHRAALDVAGGRVDHRGRHDDAAGASLAALGDLCGDRLRVVRYDAAVQLRRRPQPRRSLGPVVNTSCS